ncbi:MAG: hypothetical protein WDM89_21115 [Rhizomicrobium sp.]
MLFSLGKAYNDRKLHEQAFAAYAKANALHRMEVRYDPDNLTRYVDRCRALFTAEFFRDRSGFGASSDEPIFIVGMARLRIDTCGANPCEPFKGRRHD